MFSMFNALFSAIGKFFSALEKVGNTSVHLATIGEEMSKSYLDETRVNRAATLKRLNAEFGLAITETV